MFSSIEEAKKTLDDVTRPALDREDAVHYLAKQDDPNILRRLVTALDDDVFGVRWAAAIALAEMGKAAIPHVLSALTVNAGSSWMREGVYHVLHYNTSLAVREKSTELMAALKGPAADMASPAAAARLREALA